MRNGSWRARQVFPVQLKFSQGLDDTKRGCVPSGRSLNVKKILRRGQKRGAVGTGTFIGDGTAVTFSEREQQFDRSKKERCLPRDVANGIAVMESSMIYSDARTPKMNRIGRRSFIARAVATLAFGAFALDAARAGSGMLDADKLKDELRATTAAQATFIDDVVDKVQKGLVPEKMLYAAYKFAMKKEVGRRVFYFRLCLVELAKRARLKVKFLSF